MGKIGNYKILGELTDDTVFIAETNEGTRKVPYSMLDRKAEEKINTKGINEAKAVANTALENVQSVLTAIDELQENINASINNLTEKLNSKKCKAVYFVRNDTEAEETMNKLDEGFGEMAEGDYALFFIPPEYKGESEMEYGIMVMIKENEAFTTYNLLTQTMIEDAIKKECASIKKELELIKPKLNITKDRSITLEHNNEYRNYDAVLFGSTWLQLNLPLSIPDNYMANLVFVSGEEPTTLSYPDSIIFTGDDVIDDVLVPVANKVYNVVFWYDGINVNAVSRGVPYAKE